jgi:hypothetical protein
MDEDADWIVACALLTKVDFVQLGSSLRCVYPLAQDSSFDELLRRLDSVPADGLASG